MISSVDRSKVFVVNRPSISVGGRGPSRVEQYSARLGQFGYPTSRTVALGAMVWVGQMELSTERALDLGATRHSARTHGQFMS